MRAFEDELRDLAYESTRDLTLPAGAATKALAAAGRARRRRWAAAVGMALLAALAVILGLVLPAGGASLATVSPAPEQGLAAEASRLLTLIDLPPGSRPTTQQPAHLPVPPVEPVVSGVVNRSRLVEVPLSLGASMEYLRTHTPRGLVTEGTDGRIVGPGFEVDYGMWGDPSPAGLGTGQLLISVIAVGPSSTVWGLDGQIYPSHAPGTYAQTGPLRPHYPNGVSNCGSYAINATTRQGTTPLASCAALAGVVPLPTISVAVGGQVLMTSHVSATSWSAAPAGILSQDHDTFTALHPGSAVITVHDASCVPPPTGSPQPTSCAVVRVEVS